MRDAIQILASPELLFTRSEVFQRPSPAPAARGVYAWFFREVPKGIPVENCTTHDGLRLLYIGIAPSRDSSKATLRRRLRQHFAGNASASTLRLTLGCLLGLPLAQVGRSKRLTFGEERERRLSEWMSQNAFVCWVEHPAPWEVEAEMIAALRPPLNLDDSTHAFKATLSRLRRDTMRKARLALRPDVLVLSEQRARLYEPSGTELCISITNPDEPPPSLSDKFLAVLRLTFTDIAKPSPFRWDLLFNVTHANQILTFVRQHRDVERIVIHCMAGQSRSPGVAMALCELFGWRTAAELEQQFPLWNTWVRDELLRVGRELPDGGLKNG